MALHDHFSHLAHLAAEAISREHTREVQSDPAGMGSEAEVRASAAVMAGSMQVTALQDRWTLSYINVFRVQQLMEAIDTDVSSFISVPEINTFTAARPPDWR